MVNGFKKTILLFLKKILLKQKQVVPCRVFQKKIITKSSFIQKYYI
jgi:hypothetical protein